jgi:hypothetical protein
MAKVKTIQVTMKSGAQIEAPYSSKFYGELADNLGKDHVAVHPSASINCKEVQGIVFNVEEVPDEA